MVSYDQVFSVYALFVMFRESLECSLIVAILMEMCVKLNRMDLKRWVWYGVASGVGVSIVVGIAFIICFYAFKKTVFKDSASAELFEGVCSWVSAVIIGILSFSMLRFMGWEAKWQRRLKESSAQAVEFKNSGATDEEMAVQAAEHEEQIRIQNRKEAWKVWLIIFAIVLREGIEAVVFIAGVNEEHPSAIPLPAFVGILCGCLAGVLLYYTGKVVEDIKWVFIVMTGWLLIMGAGQIANGVEALASGNGLGGPTKYEIEELGYPPIWYLKPLWDWSACCSIEPDENKFFSLAHAIVGYQDKGTALMFILYFGYWICWFAFAAYRWHQGSLFDADWQHTKAQREAEAQAKLANQELGVMPLSELKGVLAEQEKIVDVDRQSSSEDSAVLFHHMEINSPQPSTTLESAPSTQVLLAAAPQ